MKDRKLLQKSISTLSIKSNYIVIFMQIEYVE